MKNFVRALAIALTFAGSVAYTQIHTATRTGVLTARVNQLPMPCCPPNDPNACGFGK